MERLKLKCPHCELIFEDDDLYIVHVCSHGGAQVPSAMKEISIVKEAIKKIIIEKQGCKIIDLIASIPPEIIAGRKEIPALIQHMVNCGELVEVEYVLPNLPIRIKSFLLPPGTVITFHTPKKYDISV